MTKLNTLLLSLTLTITAPVALAEDAHETSDSAQHGKPLEPHAKKPDFFPKKQPNKALGTRPAEVELLEPKALAVTEGSSLVLKWKPVEGADSYRVQVAEDPNFKWLVVQKDFHPETTLQIQDLKSGTHYFWRVYAWKHDNDASWMSSFGTFSSFEVR